MKDLQGVEIKEAPEEVGSNCPSENSDKTAEFNKVIKKCKKMEKWIN